MDKWEQVAKRFDQKYWVEYHEDTGTQASNSGMVAWMCQNYPRIAAKEMVNMQFEIDAAKILLRTFGEQP